jgi:hypothetical protein
MKVTPSNVLSAMRQAWTRCGCHRLACMPCHVRHQHRCRKSMLMFGACTCIRYSSHHALRAVCARTEWAAADNRGSSKETLSVARILRTLLILLELPDVPIAAAAAVALYSCIREGATVRCSIPSYFHVTLGCHLQLSWRMACVYARTCSQMKMIGDWDGTYACCRSLDSMHG